MLRSIVQKEWAELRQDRRFWLVALGLYVLFGLGLAEGYGYYTATARTHEQAAAASYQQWLDQGTKNPHGAAHYGFYAFKPLSPLAVVDRGMEDYLGQSVWLEAHNQNEVKDRAANDQGTIARFGLLTVGFVWQFLVPLAIILLGFNLYSKEREGGTLRLLLSAGTSLPQLLWGKALALYGAVLVLTLPMLMIATVAAQVAGGAAMGEFAGRWMLLCGLYLAYWALWVGGALAVSYRAAQSGLALVALIGFWTWGCFFVPRLSGSVAKALHPAPSSFAFSREVQLDTELGLDRQTPAKLRAKRLVDSLLAHYQADSLQKLPVNFTGVSLQANEDYGYQVFEKNYGHLHGVYRAQDQAMEWGNLLSPPLAMRSLQNLLGGTGLVRHLDFARQAEAHRRLIAETMNDDLARNGAGKPVHEGGTELWKKIPPFTYQPSPLAADLPAASLGLLALALWLAGVAGVLLATRRAGEAVGG